MFLLRNNTVKSPKVIHYQHLNIKSISKKHPQTHKKTAPKMLFQYQKILQYFSMGY